MHILDFSPLQSYSKAFRIFRTIRRVRMVAVRAVFILIAVALLAIMITAAMNVDKIADAPVRESTARTSTDSGDSYDITIFLIVVFVLAVVGPLATRFQMKASWERFISINKLARVARGSDDAGHIMNVPSFRAKLLSQSLEPVEGQLDQWKFALFTRQYKEGGVLRWRENQMDTIVAVLFPAVVPHIIINARSNEKARLSNLTSPQKNEHKFQFEGSMGAHYDVYTAPENRILAFQLFTPDVLQIVYDLLPSADIELYENKLWIVQRYGVLDDELAERQIKAAALLEGELGKQMKSAKLL